MGLEIYTYKRDNKYPAISRMWRNNLENVSTLFAYPDEIRKLFILIMP